MTKITDAAKVPPEWLRYVKFEAAYREAKRRDPRVVRYVITWSDGTHEEGFGVYSGWKGQHEQS